MGEREGVTYPEKKPKGWIYVEGACRNEPDDQKSHIYAGPSYHDLMGPLCPYGWNRSNGHGFSILRRNRSRRGTCALCQKQAEENGGPVPPKTRKTRWI